MELKDVSFASVLMGGKMVLNLENVGYVCAFSHLSIDSLSEESLKKLAQNDLVVVAIKASVIHHVINIRSKGRSRIYQEATGEDECDCRHFW